MLDIALSSAFLGLGEWGEVGLSPQETLGPVRRVVRFALGTKGILPANHEILSGLRQAKYAAIEFIAHEVRAREGWKRAVAPTIDRIERWAVHERARDPDDALEPRDATADVSVSVVPEAWLRRACDRLKAELAALAPNDVPASAGLPLFTAAELEAAARIEHLLGREGAADPPEAAALAEALRAECKADIWRGAFGGTGTVDVGDFGGRDAQAFWRHFDDPALGWFAAFKVLVREVVKSDERFRAALSVTFQAEAHRRLHAIEARLSEGIAAFDDRLRALDQTLGAGIAWRGEDIAQLLAHAEDGRERLRELYEHLVLRQPALDDIAGRRMLSAGAATLDWRFTTQATRLIGREAEWVDLAKFLDDPRPVLWWQLAGLGGEGKSRLALNLVQDRAGAWLAGFLRADAGDMPFDWTSWQPKRPTLLVLDYVAAPEKTARMRHIIATMKRRADSADPTIRPAHPVRILALDRMGYDLNRAMEQAGLAPSWSQALLGGTDGGRIRDAAFAPAARQLEPLSDPVLVAIAGSWLAFHGREPLGPADSARLIAALNETRRTGSDRARQPLFAMLAAELIRRGASTDHWTGIGDLLRDVLDLERRTLWPPDCAERHWNLALLASLCNGLPLAAPALQTAEGVAFYGDQGVGDLQQAWALNGLAGQAPTLDQLDPVPPRAPDLLAEYAVLSYFGDVAAVDRGAAPRAAQQKAQRLERMLADAWSINPQAVWEFVDRAAQDFPGLDVTPALARRAVAANGDALGTARLIRNLVGRLGRAHPDRARDLYGAVRRLSEVVDQPALREEQAKAAFNLLNSLRASDLAGARALYAELCELARDFPHEPIPRLAQIRASVAMIEVLAKSEPAEAVVLYRELAAWVLGEPDDEVLREACAAARAHLRSAGIEPPDA